MLDAKVLISNGTAVEPNSDSVSLELYKNLVLSLGQRAVDEVMFQDGCDIEPMFMGMVGTYALLSKLIPSDWTVLDIGCSFAPQSWFFKDHKAYIGVDVFDCKRFAFPNTTHFTCDCGGWVQFLDSLDRDRTFAICNYVPSGHARYKARSLFKNVYCFYPR